MMPESSSFDAMRSRIEGLRDIFLPKEFDPTGTYGDDQPTRTIAFRLLAHAEIESFLEDRAKALARIALESWRRQRKPSTVLAALLAFSGLEHREPPETLAAPQPSKMKNWPQEIELDNRVAAAVAAFNHRLSRNHGIKEANLLGILLPIGLNTLDIDQTLLAELNSLGSDRGTAAHRSIQHVTTIPDPKDELARVRRIVERLKEVETKLQILESEAAWISPTGV